MNLIKVVVFLALFLKSVSVYASTDDESHVAITKLRNIAVEAYNNKNIKALMSTWHKDGNIISRINSEPDVFSGKKEIQEFYLAEFQNPHFMKISMNSENTHIINGMYIDSGTTSFINSYGKVELTGCYVMLFIKEANAFKALKEWSYPLCMNSNHH